MTPIHLLSARFIQSWRSDTPAPYRLYVDGKYQGSFASKTEARVYAMTYHVGAPFTITEGK